MTVIGVSIGAPQRIHIDPELKGKARREQAARAVGDLLEMQRYRALDRFHSLPHALAQINEVITRQAHVRCRIV